jgi:hypothetical protein
LSHWLRRTSHRYQRRNHRPQRGAAGLVGTPPPVDPSDLSFVALDTRTPYVVHFDGADGGKVVTYWLRWVSTRDDRGPWSAAVAATVPG